MWGGTGKAATVLSVEKGGRKEGVVNPLTTSGTIFAGGKKGGMVLASTYLESIGGEVDASFPLSLCSAVSLLAPETAQAKYDSIIEPSSDALASFFARSVASFPPPSPSSAIAASAAFLVADVAIASVVLAAAAWDFLLYG